jgi:hypothetical protein
MATKKVQRLVHKVLESRRKRWCNPRHEFVKQLLPIVHFYGGRNHSKYMKVSVHLKSLHLPAFICDCTCSSANLHLDFMCISALGFHVHICTWISGAHLHLDFRCTSALGFQVQICSVVVEWWQWICHLTGHYHWTMCCLHIYLTEIVN